MKIQQYKNQLLYPDLSYFYKFAQVSVFVLTLVSVYV